MLIVLVGKKGRGKSTVADYLVRKHKLKKVSAQEALSIDHSRARYLVDGLGTVCELDGLIEKGAAVWIVMKPGDLNRWRGRTVCIELHNYGSLEDLYHATEQKLWGCC